MENYEKDTKIEVGDVEFWTKPFGKDKAMITALEGGLKLFLLETHKKHPEYFELLTDDFCEEDLEGAFSVIVDPTVVQLIIVPGCGRIGFRVEAPDEEETDDE